MPGIKTEATELTVGFGLLALQPAGLTPSQIDSYFEGTLTQAKYTNYVKEFTSKQTFYEPLYNVGWQLRTKYSLFSHSTVNRVRWEGPKQQASTGSISKDLLVLSTPISVKADSNVVQNPSPYNLFVSTPQCGPVADNSDNWFLELAPVEYQELYTYCRNKWVPTFPESVVDYHNKVTSEDREKLQDKIKTCTKLERNEFQKLYLALCHRVAILSAERFNFIFKQFWNGKSKASVEERILRTFFRMDVQEYLLCGLDKDFKYGLKIPDLRTWKTHWRLTDAQAIADLARGQSVVEFVLNIENKASREPAQFRYHAEIRWSHGKFEGNPEAKLYKGGKGKAWSWSTVPFFEQLVIDSRKASYMPAKINRLEELGQGGYGIVWRATKGDSKEEFALKELSDPNLGTEELERFIREVQIQSKLKHPNIVPVLDSDLSVLPPWFAMPIAKCTLADEILHLRKDFPRIRRLFLQVLHGVSFIHSHKEKFVHRDLKPSNVLIFEDEHVKISDFGLCKQTSSTSSKSSFTKSGIFAGSFEYASPEQLVDMKSADERSDIYTLGKILYEMITSDKPFPNFKMLNSVPEQYRHIIEKCTADNPSDRYQTVDEIVKEIEQIDV